MSSDENSEKSFNTAGAIALVGALSYLADSSYRPRYCPPRKNPQDKKAKQYKKKKRKNQRKAARRKNRR